MSFLHSPQPRFRLNRPPGAWRQVVTGTLTGQTTRSKDSDDDITALESLLADWMSVPHAICVSQGRTALYLALRELIEPGQAVILSPFTFHEVVNMVLCAGGRPLFADVEPGTSNIDAAEVERLLAGEDGGGAGTAGGPGSSSSAASPNIGAVIATHLHGIPCDIERIAAACAAHGVTLIEDAAQCFGGRIGGRHVGTFGDVGIFSFNRIKNVASLYGGLLVTGDGALADRVRAAIAPFPYESPARLLAQALRCQMYDIATAPGLFPLFTHPLMRLDALRGPGILGGLIENERAPARYDHMPARYLRRMTPLQARLVLRQLEHVDTHTKDRVLHARAYHAGLAGLPGVVLPRFRGDGSNIYLSLPVQVPDRAGLLRHLVRRGRDVRGRQYANAADLACYAEFARDCPNARAAAERGFLLPTYPGYAESEVRANVRAIGEYCKGAGE